MHDFTNVELVSNREVSNLEGRLKTLIEALGLKESQETSTKDILDETLWSWFIKLNDYDNDYLKAKQEFFNNK